MYTSRYSNCIHVEKNLRRSDPMDSNPAGNLCRSSMLCEMGATPFAQTTHLMRRPQWPSHPQRTEHTSLRKNNEVENMARKIPVYYPTHTGNLASHILPLIVLAQADMLCALSVTISLWSVHYIVSVWHSTSLQLLFLCSVLPALYGSALKDIIGADFSVQIMSSSALPESAGRTRQRNSSWSDMECYTELGATTWVWLATSSCSR